MLLSRRIASLLHAGPRGQAASLAVVSARRQYHQNIVEHYENPRNVGECRARGRDGAFKAEF